MTKAVRSYNDLLKEEERLESLLEVQKKVLRSDLERVKEELQPVRKVFDFVKKITTMDRTNLLLSLGSEIAINTIFKRFLRKRLGWVARVAIPFFLSNYSSHFIAENKDKWIEKLTSWLRGIRNGRQHADEEMREPER